MEINRSDLIKIIADKCPQLEASDVESAVRCILDKMTATLSSGGNIEIRGFGSFKLHYRAPRIGRNPKSGETIELCGKYVPHFKPGKDLRNRVDESKPLTISHAQVEAALTEALQSSNKAYVKTNNLRKRIKFNHNANTKKNVSASAEEVEAALTEALRRQ